MEAATLTTKALVQSNVGYVTFPHKEELTFCIIEVIKEEPLASLTIVHQAMETIILMTALRPRMDPLLRSQPLQKTIRKVFQLPSLQVTKVKAGSSVPATEPGLLSRDHLHLAQHAHQVAVGGPLSGDAAGDISGKGAPKVSEQGEAAAPMPEDRPS
ncbi:uncharacterized protein LOC144328293 [Podarcis muralis]